MQNEATNTVQALQSRIIGNKHFAAQLRSKLMQPCGRAKQGYGPDDVYSHILNSLDDEQLVSKYIAHSVVKKMPIEQIREMNG